MFSDELSHLTVEADDLYWYTVWLRLSPLDKKRHPATKAFAQNLPQFCQKIVAQPFLQWAYHKRLLNLQYSIEEVEWSLLTNLLESVDIATVQVQINAKGYVIYNQSFYDLLAAVAQRIQQLQTFITQKEQQARFPWLPWLDSHYRRAINHKSLLFLLSGYLSYYLSSFQKLNQPWREPYVNVYQVEFNHYFHSEPDKPTIYERLPNLGKGLLAALGSLQTEQLNALTLKYRQKIEAIQQAIAILYEVKFSKKAMGKTELSFKQNLNYQKLSQVIYDKPLVIYTDLVELLHRYIPRLSDKLSKKNIRQQVELRDKIQQLDTLLAESQANQKTTANLKPNTVYLQRIASIIQSATDYLVKALIIDKDVFNYYVKCLLSILNPEHEVLKNANLVHRCVIASLALLSLRELIKHCARGIINEENAKQLVMVINTQIDVLRLRLFI